MELQLRGSGWSISSGLSSKKCAGLCFEGLWTCLGDNNSPVDACQASPTLLTLPPTLLAPPHLNHLHGIRFPCIYYSSHPQFTVSLWPAASVTYISYSTVYIISNTCGRKKGEFVISASQMTLVLLLSSVWVKPYEWPFFQGYWYPAGGSITRAHFWQPTLQGRPPLKRRRRGKKISE